jgi:PAS domain S-box-containing protein
MDSVVSVNVNERSNAESEIRTSETRYRRLFESAKDGFLIIDAVTGKVIDVNSSLLVLLGFAREELLDKDISEIRSFKNTAIPRDVFKELQSKDYVYFDDLPLETCDGRLIRVEFVGNVCLVGHSKLIQCNFRDISERKRNKEEHRKFEEQLQMSQRMEAIGSLAGGVAHDFNNLISVILSYTDFAMQDLQERDPLKLDLLEVRKAGERAASLTRQLLAFGRKQILQPVPLNLNQVALGLEKMLRRILGEDIDFILNLAPDLGMVRADPGQIEQVIMNLIVNARDAMSSGGTLTIATSNVEVEDECATQNVGINPGPYVRLTVTDTGCGMDPSTKLKIFEPFFTTKQQTRGTGLGLSTVYGIIKQSGGNIWVDSELNFGTTFKVHLPREVSAKVSSTRLRAIVKPAEGTETILVVEDEDAIRKIASRALESSGYSVLAAAAGDEALQMAKDFKGSIDLLLTDVVMPRMRGEALAQSILKWRPMVKILYMSGYTDSTFFRQGMVDENINFIGKPFTGTDLVNMVRTVLDNDLQHLPEEGSSILMAEVIENDILLEKAAVHALPEIILESLRKVVFAARFDEIVEIVEKIRLIDPKIASKLQRMTEHYDYDGMRDLLG